MSQKASRPSKLEHLDQTLMDHILCKHSVEYSLENKFSRALTSPYTSENKFDVTQ